MTIQRAYDKVKSQWIKEKIFSNSWYKKLKVLGTLRS